VNEDLLLTEPRFEMANSQTQIYSCPTPTSGTTLQELDQFRQTVCSPRRF